MPVSQESYTSVVRRAARVSRHMCVQRKIEYCIFVKRSYGLRGTMYRLTTQGVFIMLSIPEAIYRIAKPKDDRQLLSK